MSTDETDTDREALVDRIKHRLDDLEERLGADLDRGRGKIGELTASVRAKVDGIRSRGQSKDEEVERVSEIRDDLDELETAIDERAETETEEVSGIVDDLRDRLSELERKIRRR